MDGMVIVGAGECGTRAALALREAGYDGPVTLVGAERHAPYERPPLSKQAITGAPEPKGIAGAMYFVEQYRKAMPDIQFKITHLIADPDFVTFRFEAEATHQGELMGIPATGRRVKVSGIVIHQVVNGRFAKSWNEVDLLGLRSQIAS